MNDIVMLIACWRRPMITKDCYDSISRWPVRRVWIVSNEDPHKDQIYDIVQGDTVVEFSNVELGRKMNAGIRYVYENIPDWRYLMNWGSDDLGSPKLLEMYKPYMDRNTLMFGINNVYVFDTHTGEVVFFRDYNMAKPVGAGRMIHRTLIELMLQQKHTVYTDQARSGLDGDSQKRILTLTEVKPTVIDAGDQVLMVDLKTACNINPFVYFREKPKVGRDMIDAEFGDITLKYPRRPKVTVIIPYCKDRGWLKQARQSVKAQTYPNIQLVESRSPGSVAANFNAGLQRAKGDLICYLCDDDELPENSVAERVKVWIADGCDLVHGNCEDFYPDGKIVKYIPRSRVPSLQQMIDRNVMSGGTVMYHRSVFERWGGFDETLRNGEEYEFNMRCMSQGAVVSYINDTLYRYRRHDGQKSHTADQVKRAKEIDKIRARYGKQSAFVGL